MSRPKATLAVAMDNKCNKTKSAIRKPTTRNSTTLFVDSSSQNYSSWKSRKSSCTSIVYRTYECDLVTTWYRIVVHAISALGRLNSSHICNTSNSHNILLQHSYHAFSNTIFTKISTLIDKISLYFVNDRHITHRVPDRFRRVLSIHVRHT